MKKSALTFSETIRPGDVIALGDIHGSWDLYSQFLAWIKDSEASVILLGDLIDRGDGDMEVLNATRKVLHDPESWGLQSFNALRGNHEQMFIDAASGQKYPMKLWQSNGGDIQRLPEMVDEHLEWIEALPIYMTIGDTMFAHAGVLPGEDPAETIARGKLEELVWVRNPFLTKGPQFAKWSKTIKKVVHGHTITLYERDQVELGPIVRKDRVNIDTGAFLPEGYLTAYNVTQDTFNRFDRYPQL